MLTKMQEGLETIVLSLVALAVLGRNAHQDAGGFREVMLQFRFAMTMVAMLTKMQEGLEAASGEAGGGSSRRNAHQDAGGFREDLRKTIPYLISCRNAHQDAGGFREFKPTELSLLRFYVAMLTKMQEGLETVRYIVCIPPDGCRNAHQDAGGFRAHQS